MPDSSLPPVLRDPLSTGQTARAASDSDSAPGAAESNSASAPSEGITSNRPLVFAILFGVTGALGLPLLWFSPAFTRQEKWLWSIVNSLYTAGLVAIAIASLKVIFDAMEQLQ